MQQWIAGLGALGTGIILWLLGYIGQRQGWVFNRRTEDNKLAQQRLETLESENNDLRELVQELRLEIIHDKLTKIGSAELSDRQRRLLTYTIEDLRRIPFQDVHDISEIKELDP